VPLNILIVALFVTVIAYFPEGLSDGQVILDHQALRKLLTKYGTPQDLQDSEKRNGLWHSYKTVPYAILHILAYVVQVQYLPIHKALLLAVIEVIVGRYMTHSFATATARGIPINTMPSADSCELYIVQWRFWKWGWDFSDAFLIMTCETFKIGLWDLYIIMFMIPTILYFLI